VVNGTVIPKHGGTGLSLWFRRCIVETHTG
jgi:hypothetical protein